MRKLVQNLKISVTKTIPLLYILSLSLRELNIFHVTGIVKFIGIIHKWSFCLPTTSLCALYYSLVHLCLIYCVSVSGSTSRSKFNCIVTPHEKVVGIISRVSYNSQSENLFNELTIHKFQVIYSNKIWKPCVSFYSGDTS